MFLYNGTRWLRLNIWDFLQWLSVGGVTIFSVLATSKKDSRNNEHSFIDQLQEELRRNTERLDAVVKRLDDIESENYNLKQLNYKLQIERDNAIDNLNRALVDKENIEKALIDKIDKLSEENTILKERVLKLEQNIINN